MTGPVAIQAWSSGTWVKLVVIDALFGHQASDASHDPSPENGWLVVFAAVALLAAVLWLIRRRR